MVEVESNIAELLMMPSCQVSTVTIKFDCNEGTLTEEQKMVEFSLADFFDW